MKNSVFILILTIGASYAGTCQISDSRQRGLLDSLSAAVETNRYTDINSILISKGGNLLYERYFNGWTKDSLHDLRSSFKSFTSLLVGIAIDHGFIRDVHQKVYLFFPGHTLLGDDDTLKSSMTIKDLLCMRSGFDCEEFNDGKDCETDMMASNDWLRFSLDLPMKHPPGKVWAYTSCDPMIIGGIISQTSKMSIMEFARRYLFEPLGIISYRWTVDPSGHGWYAERIRTSTYSEDVLFTSGNGGKYIMIVKRLDLVVVFTQANYSSWKAKRAFDLLIRYILPLFESNKR